MKKHLLVFGCAALAAFSAACSSDPALKSAVISPMEEPSAQIQQRFANEIRTLNDQFMICVVSATGKAVRVRYENIETVSSYE